MLNVIPENNPEKTVGASLLAKAAAQPTASQADPPLSRASPLPQGICAECDTREQPGKNCGSEPAREGGGTTNSIAS
ncbi:hypothetical protein B0E42_12600 [Pseudomonas sp. A25(2017)]|nr:hypothetical protein B0E42_12600 [Pseudomonas sp. A25(2017)]